MQLANVLGLAEDGSQQRTQARPQRQLDCRPGRDALYRNGGKLGWQGLFPPVVPQLIRPLAGVHQLPRQRFAVTLDQQGIRQRRRVDRLVKGQMELVCRQQEAAVGQRPGLDQPRRRRLEGVAVRCGQLAAIQRFAGGTHFNGELGRRRQGRLRQEAQGGGAEPNPTQRRRRGDGRTRRTGGGVDRANRHHRPVKTNGALGQHQVVALRGGKGDGQGGGQ